MPLGRSRLVVDVVRPPVGGDALLPLRRQICWWRVHRGRRLHHRKCREATAAFQKSVNAFIRQGQYYGDVTWLLDYAEVLVMPRAANQGRNLAEGLQTTKRALSHSRCHEECLERLSVAWKTTKGSESDAARRLIRRSENGRLTLAAPYAERLQTQVPTTTGWAEANASSS